MSLGFDFFLGIPFDVQALVYLH